MAESLGFFEGFFPARRRRIDAAKRAAAIDAVDFAPAELLAQMPDPAAAKAWKDRETSLKQLAHSDDQALQMEAIRGLAEMSQQVQSAYAADREKRGTFVVETLRDQRTRYTANAKAMREVDANMRELDSLLADKNFDPDKPINAGQLLKLIHSGPRQVFDSQDMADAIGRVGGGVGPLALLGPLAALVSGEMKAEQFRMSKDEWRTLAKAAYIYTMKPLRDEADAITAGATALEPVATRLGLFPAGYSPVAFVTEQNPNLEDIKDPAPPQNASAPSGPNVARVQQTAKEFTSGLRETLFGRSWGEDHPQFVGPKAPVPYESNTSLFEGYFKPYRDDGAAIMTDPGTGDTFASYPNGRRVQIKLPLIGQWHMKVKANQLRSQRK